MDLLDRYLQAVKRYLPKGQQDDIIKELSANILSEMEDREAELGRPLNETEQETILTKQGSPLLVAGHYQPDYRSVAFGQKLIGPALFPFYTRVLRFNLGLTLLVSVGIAIALQVSGGPLTFMEMVPAIIAHILFQFAIVTLIFTAVESNETKFPNSWNPRHRAAVRKDPYEISRSETVFELVALFIFLSWLLSVRDFPSLTFGPLKLAPVWQQIYLPVVLLTLAGIAQAGVNVLRPRWTQQRVMVHAVTSGIGLLIMFFLVVAGEWVVLADATATLTTGARQTLENFNQWLFYSLLITGIVFVAVTVHDIRRLIRSEYSPAPLRA